ncbi:hypothetical protein C8Q76DRAFT_421654 [Earliella scabrosa]|nr:hypothetical protein C8Q76DRAFT_421654 [Earliella scabrosa]
MPIALVDAAATALAESDCSRVSALVPPDLDKQDPKYVSPLPLALRHRVLMSSTALHTGGLMLRAYDTSMHRISMTPLEEPKLLSEYHRSWIWISQYSALEKPGQASVCKLVHTMLSSIATARRTPARCPH